MVSPVVSLSTSRADAVPQGINSWLQLANWSDPEAHKYEITYKNLYGMEVVKYAFLVTYSYGGNVNGKGKYLSEVGFNNFQFKCSLDVQLQRHSEVVRVVNVGTSEDPLQVWSINLNWIVKTPIQEQHSTTHFIVRGDGSFKSPLIEFFTIHRVFFVKFFCSKSIYAHEISWHISCSSDRTNC